MPKRIARLLLTLCCALALAGCGQASAGSPRILLIGNSYTYSNVGIGRVLEGLAPDAFVETMAMPGYSLEDHWIGGEAVSKIQGGDWDFVILQEQSQRPVVSPTNFAEYAKGFDRVVRDAGAQTVLMMTWERPDSVAAGVTSSNLANAYGQVGVELGARVAPVGLAFARSRFERPDILLYSDDGHPTSQGTYLAACVLYGTLFTASPVGNRFMTRDVPRSDFEFLQEVAAEILGF